jgi:hypothetical protein
MGCDDVDWIHMAQERVECRGLVNAVMNVCVRKTWGFFRLGE